MDDQRFETIIEAKQKLINLNIKELVSYRDLILLFVKRDFVSLYKQTILGPLWAIIQPLLTTIVFTFIFGNVAGLSASGVPTFVFYLSGTVLWAYFAGCLTTTSNTFVSNRAILGKVYFPRMVMPISTVLSHMISLGIQFIMFLLFNLYYCFSNRGVHINILILMTPLLFLQLAILSLGCGIIVSALTTKYRDLAMLVSFLVELWRYLSPVAYDMYKMNALAPGGKYYCFYMLNPVTPVINAFRYAWLGIGAIDWMFYGVGWIMTAVIFLLGVVIFNRVERTFMDTI